MRPATQLRPAHDHRNLDDGSLTSLAKVLGQAARRGHPETCKAIAILAAAHLARAGLHPHSGRSASYRTPENLRDRLSLPTIGSAKVLSVLLDNPGQPLPISEIAKRCGCGKASATSFASQLRAYLRSMGVDEVISGGASSNFQSSTSLEAYIHLWEEIQAIVAIARDRQLFEFILKDRLSLSTLGEAKMLRALIQAPDEATEGAWLARTLPCDPSSILITVSRLRRSLRHLGLESCVLTIQTGSKRAKARYGLATGSRTLLFEAVLAPMMRTQEFEGFDSLLANLLKDQPSLRNGRQPTEFAWRRQTDPQCHASSPATLAAVPQPS